MQALTVYACVYDCIVEYTHISHISMYIIYIYIYIYSHTNARSHTQAYGGGAPITK